MRIRRIVGAAMVATLAIGVAACSNDEKADKADDAESTTSAPGSSSSVPKLSDDEYAAAVEPLTKDLDGAGTDLCKVLEVAYSSGPQAPPSSKAQVKVTVAAQAKILRAIANTEPKQEQSAAVLTETADNLESKAEEAGYSIEFFQTDVNTLFDTEDFRNAIAPYQSRQTAECMPQDASAGGSDPSAGEDPAAPTTTPSN